ncbi:unnamed protein product [Adineta steineri]|uniref:NAD(P)(+)--arginine ADP-ribosyltransferase n=1 Tax=Adineta steineri TaxID=433720 RepID=A0A819VLY0_9BILA|nr:unnamed protein product [Adineta steineri]
MSGSKLNQNAVIPSKSTTSFNIRQPRQRMAQNYILLWVDTNIDQKNEDYENTLKQIHAATGDISVFTQRDACIDFLTDAQEDIKSFLVVKDTMFQQIMLLINNIPQLNGVYIFDGIEIQHEQWAKKCDKIKSVHTNIDDLCQTLQIGIKQFNQDTIAMSFITASEMVSTDNLNQLEPTFMYTQLFKETLLDMEHNKQSIKDFITYCRDHDCVASKYIDRFEKEYSSQLAIWWYTFPSNIYSMLNYALRSMEGDTIINMGFFIHDLHQQIQQLHQQQINSYHDKPFIVYRGQGLSKASFKKLQKTKGGMMSFNNFLSTTTEQDVALGLAYSSLENTDMVGILFKMLIDPRIKSASFASINEVSYYNEEKEILFSMHTVFRVSEIKQIDNTNQLYQVELQLTSDDDQQLRILTDRIRDETLGSTGWPKLGSLLLKTGQFNKAEELYNVLLEQAYDDGEKALYSLYLGLVHSNQGDYNKAIRYYENTLEIQQKTLPSNHCSYAMSYNNIGSVYDIMGDYSKALLYYENALKIDKQTLPSNHRDLATTYSNTGLVYNNMGEYSKALSSHKIALEIRQKTLPSSHPDLAASYNNIGLVYTQMGEYLKALSFYETALEILQKTLPSIHADLATSYSNIGLVYDKMGEHSKALSFYEKAVEIRRKTLPSSHPDLATSYNNIGLMYNNIGENSKSLSSHETALEIYQKTLPSNHRHLSISHSNIGLVYNSMGDYSKALSFYEKAFAIYQKTLPSNHPDLATLYNNIGLVYNNMGEYSKALSFYEKGLEIDKQTLPSSHPDLAISYKNVGKLYNKMGEYSKALSSHEKALEIRQKILPSNHPALTSSYNDIGLVYYNMGQYLKADSYYKRAQDIL